MANGCMVHLLSQAMTEKENEQRTVDNSQALSSSVEANTFYEVLNLVSIKPGDPKREPKRCKRQKFYKLTRVDVFRWEGKLWQDLSLMWQTECQRNLLVEFRWRTYGGSKGFWEGTDCWKRWRWSVDEFQNLEVGWNGWLWHIATLCLAFSCNRISKTFEAHILYMQVWSFCRSLKARREEQMILLLTQNKNRSLQWWKRLSYLSYLVITRWEEHGENTWRRTHTHTHMFGIWMYMVRRTWDGLLFFHSFPFVAEVGRLVMHMCIRQLCFTVVLLSS